MEIHFEITINHKTITAFEQSLTTRTLGVHAVVSEIKPLQHPFLFFAAPQGYVETKRNVGI